MSARLSPRRDWATGREQRTYRCKGCGATERDYWMPPGWLRVEIRDPTSRPDDHTYRIVAIACTAACLLQLARQWAAAVTDQEAPADAGR